MTTLEARLVELGDGLRFPGADTLADDVVAAITTTPARWRRPLLVAAAILLAVATAVVAVPDSRHAVARWLGLERLPVEVVGGLSEAARADLGPPRSLTGAMTSAGVVAFVAPSLGEPVAVHAPGGRYVAVRYDDAGTAVLVTTLPGELDRIAFRKLVASGVQVAEVDVAGRDGVWITGEPHVFMYVDPSGSMTEARPAADTLAWQVGDVIVRVEGDIPLARAQAIAADLRPAG